MRSSPVSIRTTGSSCGFVTSAPPQSAPQSPVSWDDRRYLIIFFPSPSIPVAFPASQVNTVASTLYLCFLKCGLHDRNSHTRERSSVRACWEQSTFSDPLIRTDGQMDSQGCCSAVFWIMSSPGDKHIPIRELPLWGLLEQKPSQGHLQAVPAALPTALPRMRQPSSTAVASHRAIRTQRN